MKSGGQFNPITFHANAALVSWGESVSDVGMGMKNFFWDDRREFSDQVHKKAKEKLGLGYASTGFLGEGLVRLFANATYLVGRTFNDTGTAIGTGAAMMAVGKSGEEIALGASVFISGMCGAVSLAVAPLVPKPTIPGFATGFFAAENVGALALAPAYAVPAGNIATGVFMASVVSRGGGSTSRPQHVGRNGDRNGDVKKTAGYSHPKVPATPKWFTHGDTVYYLIHYLPSKSPLRRLLIQARRASRHREGGVWVWKDGKVPLQTRMALVLDREFKALARRDPRVENLRSRYIEEVAVLDREFLLNHLIDGLPRRNPARRLMTNLKRAEKEGKGAVCEARWTLFQSQEFRAMANTNELAAALDRELGRLLELKAILAMYGGMP